MSLQHPQSRAQPYGMRWEPPPEVTGFPESFGRGATRLALRHYLGAKHINRHHIPTKGPVILVANHPTLGDPFIVAFGTKRWVSWLAWDEAFEWPGAGQIMRLYKAIPLNLERPKPSSIKAAYGVLARGRVLGMFFEGERSFTYGLNAPVKTGAARIALKTDAVIVPCTVSGARRAWPRERPYPKPGKVMVRYHEPIDPSTIGVGLHRKERGELITRRLEAVIGTALPPQGTSRFYR